MRTQHVGRLHQFTQNATSWRSFFLLHRQLTTSAQLNSPQFFLCTQCQTLLTPNQRGSLCPILLSKRLQMRWQCQVESHYTFGYIRHHGSIVRPCAIESLLGLTLLVRVQPRHVRVTRSSYQGRRRFVGTT